MVSNSIASIMPDTKRDKVIISLNTDYTMRGLKLSESDEMFLLAIYTEIIKAKIGRTVEDE